MRGLPSWQARISRSATLDNYRVVHAAFNAVLDEKGKLETELFRAPDRAASAQRPMTGASAAPMPEPALRRHPRAANRLGRGRLRSIA
jgi:hypothetical protein